jgi:hypothetical protein
MEYNQEKLHDEDLAGFVKNAKFIDEDVRMRKSPWPDDVDDYYKTRNYTTRLEDLSFVFDEDHVERTIQDGQLYGSANGCFCFVMGFEGIALYVIVSRNVIEDSIEYTKDNVNVDYQHRLVSLWAYIYNEEQAESSDTYDENSVTTVMHYCNMYS